MSIILHYLAEKLLLYSNNFKTECYVGGTIISEIILKKYFSKNRIYHIENGQRECYNQFKIYGGAIRAAWQFLLVS